MGDRSEEQKKRLEERIGREQEIDEKGEKGRGEGDKRKEEEMGEEENRGREEYSIR